jgi:hypothetical protein
MKTHVHLWQYRAEFFLEQEMLQIEVVERKSEHTFYVLWLSFFLSENRAVCMIMWKNMVEPERPEMTI